MIEERDCVKRAITPRTKLRILVPATSGNMGAGFDVLGLALSLHNEFVTVPAKRTHITLTGLRFEMPLDETNLFYRAFAHLYAVVGQKPPPLEIEMRLRLPSGGGLGSSATAVVGGLVAANAYLGTPFTFHDLLPHAVDLELGRHPDNVAPALLGGLVVNVVDGEHVLSVPVPFPTELRAVLYIPEFAMDTIQGRALMPQCYERADVVFNTSRVALFLTAVTQQRFDLLRIAMEDRMHQPYRAQLFPTMPDLIETAVTAGAWGACLAGGGSSILALASDHFPQIAAALRATGRAAGLTGRTEVLDIAHAGTRVLAEGECE
jgi:homoserine kinase